MKLMSFEVAGRRSFGAVAGRGVVDLGRRLGASCADLRALLAMDGLGRAADLAAGASADYALDEVVFLPPVPAPDKIVCVGVNYADRNTEYTNLEVPEISQHLPAHAGLAGGAPPGDRAAAGIRRSSTTRASARSSSARAAAASRRSARRATSPASPASTRAPSATGPATAPST